MPVPRVSRGALRSLRFSRAQNAAQYARAGRRGYASAQETAKEGAQKLGSDMPWAATSVVATVIGTYLVASGHKFKDPIDHPLPGSDHHGEDHDEEHDEEESGDEGGDDQDQEGGDEKGGDEAAQAGKDGNMEGQDDSQDDEDDSKESGDDDKRSSGGKLSGKRVPGQPEDNISKRHGGAWDQPTELEKGPNGQTRLYLPDAKGGVKRRSESAKGIVQGRSDPNDTESGSIGDVKDGSTSAAAGNVNKQQKGISNTDTKHSYDLMKGDTYSKKPEGVPETAKLTGTVDPKRGS